jgi:hypothetical protein
MVLDMASGKNGRKARPSNGIAILIAGAMITAAIMMSPALANHQPADKVVASGDKVVVAGPADEVVLLTASLRTSSPTDLILSVAMECSIITDVTTGGTTVAGATDSALAAGKVRAWVEIDGEIVPINSMSSAPAPGDDSDKVTFCNRVHQQEVEDAEDPQDGLDKLRTYVETKNANAFNWLRLNLGSGVHHIVVKGELTVDAVGEESGAEAYIGNRAIIVEPAKLANDATI